MSAVSVGGAGAGVGGSSRRYGCLGGCMGVIVACGARVGLSVGTGVAVGVVGVDP